MTSIVYRQKYKVYNYFQHNDVPVTKNIDDKDRVWVRYHFPTIYVLTYYDI